MEKKKILTVTNFRDYLKAILDCYEQNKISYDTAERHIKFVMDSVYGKKNSKNVK